MANEPTDVLMTFILSSGGVAAECTAAWDTDDTMHKDFTAGCFFEIEDFSLGGGLESEDSSEEKSGGSSISGPNGKNNLRQRNPQQNEGGGKGGSKGAARGNKFAKYVLQGSLKYPIDIQEISVTRQLDKASPILLDKCLTLTPFTKAVIVKRKTVGGVSEGSSGNHRGYLRLEFDKPLITSVDWDDGEVVKEKIKFVCRGLTVTYLPQDNTGKLGAAVSMSWTPSRALAAGGQ